MNAYRHKSFVLGDSRCQFCGTHSRTQRTSYVTDGVLQICRVLDTKRNRLLSQLSRTQCRLRRLAVSLEYGTGVHQQLHQSVHLCRQVPRVPARRQTSDSDTESAAAAAAAAGAGFSHHLK